MKNLVLILVTFGLVELTQSQSRDELAINKKNEIAARIHSYKNRSLQLRGRIVYIDSSIADDTYEYKNISDPYGTLQSCFIFFAGSSSFTEEDSSVVGVYKNGEILWLSDNIRMAETGRILCTKDLNGDGSVEIIAAWSMFAAPIYELVTIFSWDGTKGVKISSDESEMDGNAGSFQITDVDGDRIFEILATSIDEQGKSVKVVYSWNGSQFGNWPDSPTYDSRKFSVANNLVVVIESRVENVLKQLQFKYIFRNEAASKQNVKDIFFTNKTTFKKLKFNSTSGWSLNPLAQTPLFYFSSLDPLSEIPPGNLMNRLSYLADALPMVSTFYIQGPHIKPPIKSLTELSQGTRVRETNIYNNSYVSAGIGPADPPNPFVASVFLDTLISYKHQALSLGWITNKGIANSLDQKLDNARMQLEKKDNKSAKNILNAFLNEVEAQKNRHLSSEAYALLRFNAEYLISKLE